MLKLAAIALTVVVMVFPTAPASSADSECPKTCPASNGGTMAGTLPIEVSFALIFTSHVRRDWY